MNRSAKITYTVAGLVVAGLLVGAGCAVATIAAAVPRPTVPAASTPESSATPTLEPSTAPTPEPVVSDDPERVIPIGGRLSILARAVPKGCKTYAMIEIQSDSRDGDSHGELFGEPVDRGQQDGANGTVNRDDQGRIVSYTTVAGDNLDGIENRLCMDTVYMTEYNYVGWGLGEHPWSIGDTFILRPDPSAVWIPARERD